MSSLITWNRLEPVPRREDVRPSLRAPVADPLWMLARQWQFGELGGEDAGSPVEAVLSADVAVVDRFHPGAIGSNPRARAEDLPEPTAPLEAMVEAAPILGRAADFRIRVDAGQHFLRLLRRFGVGEFADRYREKFPPPELAAFDQRSTVAGAPDDGPEPPLVMACVARRTPDGRAIADALLARRGDAAELASLPDEPAVPASRRGDLLRAANAFLVWWEGHHLGEGEAAGGSWNGRRLEHECAIGAQMPRGRVVLRAENHPGGSLGWHDFDVDVEDDLGPAAGAGQPRRIVRRTLPSRVFHAGMSANRFWEFEDASVRFGVGSVGPADVAHMMLNEFALSYGDDWHVVPLRLPTGTVSAIRELTVRDTFGEETPVLPATGEGGAMFRPTARDGSPGWVRNLFFLPPSLGATPQGDDLEEVVWFRDEMANMVWAVERRLERPTGGSRPAAELYRDGSAATLSQTLFGNGEADIDADLLYRLNSRVPKQWFPLVPEPVLGGSDVQLRLRTLQRVKADGELELIKPNARTLVAADPLIVEEEEIPRSGVTTRVRWRLARDARGRYALWLGNAVAPGAGEGSSGLVFDVSRPAR